MTYVFKCFNLIPQMLIWAMFDCKYKLDQIGIIQHKLEGAKKKKKIEGLKHNPVDWIDIQQTGLGHPVDWVLKQKLQISRIQESSRLDDDLGDWINCLESDRNSRLQEFKNPID